MERFISVDPALGALWSNRLGQPVSIRARNSIVAILASLRDALRDPRRVMDLATGQIDRLPWTYFEGGKIPLVGAIPVPAQWAEGPHSEAWEGRARIVSDAISECFRELAVTGELVPRATPAGTAPGGAAEPFERYVGMVGVLEDSDVFNATIAQRADKDSDEPMLIRENPDLVRRVHDVLKFAVSEKLAILAYLRQTGTDVSAPLNISAMANSPVVLEMAQRAINARKAGNTFATVFFTALGLASALAIDLRATTAPNRYDLFTAL